MNDSTRKAILQHLATKKNFERNVAGFATVLVFPAIFAALGAFTPDIHKDYGEAIYWIWGTLVVVFILFAWRFNPTDQTAISLIVENEKYEVKIQELNDDVDQLHSAIDLLIVQSNYCKIAREVILKYTRGSEKVKDAGDFRSFCSDLTAPLYLQGEYIFGFGSSELWNFAVYLYSEKSKMLVPVWREKAGNHPSKGDGRLWGRGEGHVGKSFVDVRSIITPDARQGDAMEFSAVPPGRDLPYDKSVYVSFAAIPIGPILAKDDRPYGVVVGTSDRPGRFDREKAGILEHVAGAIAAALITGGLDVDTLSDVSRPTNGMEGDKNVQKDNPITEDPSV